MNKFFHKLSEVLLLFTKQRFNGKHYFCGTPANKDMLKVSNYKHLQKRFKFNKKDTRAASLTSLWRLYC